MGNNAKIKLCIRSSSKRESPLRAARELEEKAFENVQSKTFATRGIRKFYGNRGYDTNTKVGRGKREGPFWNTL